MSLQIAVNVLRVNDHEPENNIYSSVLIPVVNTTSEGIWWRVPTSDTAGTFRGWQYVRQRTKPTPDSVKTLRLFNSDYPSRWWAVLQDSQDVTEWANRANASTPDPWPSMVIPAPIIEIQPCPDANGKYNYFTLAQAPLPANSVYIARVTGNGAVLFDTTFSAAAAAGYANLSALVSALNTALGNAGAEVFSVDGTVTNEVKWNSTAYSSGSLSVYVAKQYTSNAAPTLTGSNVYSFQATVDNLALPALKAGTDMASILTAINASPDYLNYGSWAVSGSTIVLASNTISSASLVITQVAP